MTPEDQERMKQLCEAMQQEQDAKRLTELADELNALLLPKVGKASSAPPIATPQSQGWDQKKLGEGPFVNGLDALSLLCRSRRIQDHGETRRDVYLHGMWARSHSFTTWTQMRLPQLQGVRPVGAILSWQSRGWNNFRCAMPLRRLPRVTQRHCIPTYGR